MAIIRYMAASLALFLVSVPCGMAQEIGSQTEPVLITADELSRDEELGIVIARGNVEITQGKRILKANSVSYSEKNDTVSASGNVRLIEPSGEIVFAEFIELRDQFKNGIVKQIRVLLQDNSRFAALEARRSNGNLMVMKRGVYSPCLPCKKDPKRPLIWQIKASQIEHDEARREIRYRNAFLEVFGVPVVYVPYFSHPDPTVERKSGFLAPDFGTGGNLDGFVRIPYFMTLGDDKDITLSPIYTVKEGLVFSGEYRQRFDSGKLQLSGSITEAERTVSRNGLDVVEKDRVRGHGDIRASYDLDETWRLGADAAQATDRSYLKRFDFFGKNEDILRSNAYVEGFWPRSYVAANAFSFQDLRPVTSRPSQPIIAPLMQVNYVSEADRFGGRTSFDSDFRFLTRSDGPATQRLSIRPGYEASHTADAGFVTTFSTSIRADIYNVNQKPNPTFNSDIDDNISGRLLPRATVEWRYPFIRGTGSIRQLLEPVVMFTASPNGQNPDGIPNEDSNVFEADDTNLLSPDRLAGSDRVESGQRLVYGLRFGAYGERAGRTTAFIGQSYRLQTDDELSKNFVEDHLSDIVGRIDISPTRYVDIFYRFAFAANDLADPQRNEVAFSIGPPALRFNGLYSFISASQEFEKREEIRVRFSSKVTDYWYIEASTHHDLAAGSSLKHTATIRYEDECIGFEIIGARSFFDEEDIDPSDSVMFRIKFKHLGELGSNAQ